MSMEKPIGHGRSELVAVGEAMRGGWQQQSSWSCAGCNT